MTHEGEPAPAGGDEPSGPNPVAVGLSVIRSLITVRRPGPFGEDTWSHSPLEPALARLERDGPTSLPDLGDGLSSYLEQMSRLDPRSLTRDEALAFWINVYNAGALVLAGKAAREGAFSVLRIPGGFRRPVFSAAGEDLSLDDIEHGKLRRFGDPRVHAALVCGSVSCPTLRNEPYRGDRLHAQLDDQLSHFLTAGALVVDAERGVAHLSRVFLWFGADFVRPHRMPTFLPAGRRRVLEALTPWMDSKTAEWVETTRPDVMFQRYDWGLSCTVR